MRKLFLLAIFVLPFFLKAQEKESLQHIIDKVREKYQVDSADKEVLHLLDTLFDEGLQADSSYYNDKIMK